MYSNTHAFPNAPSQQHQAQLAARREAATTLRVMFPQFDDDIINSVYAGANGDLDAAAAQLLSLDE